MLIFSAIGQTFGHPVASWPGRGRHGAGKGRPFTQRGSGYRGDAEVDEGLVAELTRLRQTLPSFDRGRSYSPFFGPASLPKSARVVRRYLCGLTGVLRMRT